VKWINEMPDNFRQEADVNTPACDESLSRKEFLTKLVQKAALAGSLVAAPKIIDKFLVPPALAVNSTQHFHDSHAPLRNPPVGGSGTTVPSNTTNKKQAPVTAPEDNGGWG
jgi:hypothetical protein